jgi:tetratricopeptide (TPR) repeat protein
MRLVGDQRNVFVVVLVASWLVLIGAPITFSILSGQPNEGLPLVGVILWFVLLRAARWLSPPVRMDARMRRGRYAAALKLADRALALRGQHAWSGPRRLIWLNRRATALLALGRAEEALATTLDALAISVDPETLANCGSALLLLNRYDEAERSARRALDLTRERSVSANATLASVMLARGRPAEAEALARAGLADIESLQPLVHVEHHVACLAALCRSERMQGHKERESEALAHLRRVAGHRPILHAIALTELADSVATHTTDRAHALATLEQARTQAPRYVHWYAQQPHTLATLRDDPSYQKVVAVLNSAIAQVPAEAAPDAAQVAARLDATPEQVSARPAPQSSQAALVAQLVTLAATVAVLIWWAVTFYLPSAS